MCEWKKNEWNSIVRFSSLARKEQLSIKNPNKSQLLSNDIEMQCLEFRQEGSGLTGSNFKGFIKGGKINYVTTMASSCVQTKTHGTY